MKPGMFDVVRCVRAPDLGLKICSGRVRPHIANRHAERVPETRAERESAGPPRPPTHPTKKRMRMSAQLALVEGSLGLFVRLGVWGVWGTGADDANVSF